MNQSLEALESANRIRCARAELKRDVNAGRVRFASVIMDPPEYAERMMLKELLMAVRGYGDKRVREVCAVAQVSPLQKLAMVTPRQRRVLAVAVKDFCYQRAAA